MHHVRAGEVLLQAEVTLTERVGEPSRRSPRGEQYRSVRAATSSRSRPST